MGSDVKSVSLLCHSTYLFAPHDPYSKRHSNSLPRTRAANPAPNPDSAFSLSLWQSLPCTCFSALEYWWTHWQVSPAFLLIRYAWPSTFQLYFSLNRASPWAFKLDSTCTRSSCICTSKSIPEQHNTQRNTIDCPQIYCIVIQIEPRGSFASCEGLSPTRQRTARLIIQARGLPALHRLIDVVLRLFRDERFYIRVEF